jgi:hypothetical protein
MRIIGSHGTRHGKGNPLTAIAVGTIGTVPLLSESCILDPGFLGVLGVLAANLNGY